MEKICRESVDFVQSKVRAKIFCRFLTKAVFLCFVFALSACYLAILSSAVYAGLEWTADGVAIRTAKNGQYGPQIVSGGAVGVLEKGKSDKDPYVAAFLSLVIPGLGQHYNGQYMKGLYQEALFVGGILLMEDGLNNELLSLEEAVGEIGLGVLLWVGVWVWSVIDAPISAININRERSWGRFSEFNNRNGLGLTVTPKKQGIEASLTLHF